MGIGLVILKKGLELDRRDNHSLTNLTKHPRPASEIPPAQPNFLRVEFSLRHGEPPGSSNIMLRRSAFLISLLWLSLRVASAQTPAAVPDVRGRESVYDDRTKELVVRGDARLQYSDLTLTADELRYRRDTNSVTASGHFVLSRGAQRLVADSGAYDLGTGTLHVRNLRVGQFPIYVQGESVDGTFDKLVFTNATIFLRENAGYAPSIKAARLTYERGRIVSGEGLSIGLLGGHIISLPKFEHEIGADFFSYFTGKIGYRHNLGPYIEAEGRLPVARGIKAGVDLGLYASRGVLAGPGVNYRESFSDGSYVLGGLSSGFIRDHGDRLNDVLGQPIPRDRGYVEWWHRQQVGANFTLNGLFNYWSDSEVLRDFHPKQFFPVQQPDSYLEGTYAGDNYLLSALVRPHPNRYHQLIERLPEVRFDLLPSETPAGFYERAFASFAILDQDAYLSAPAQRSSRLDAYYGIERPMAVAPWLTFTPVAGARVTHYADAVGGRNSYTRTFGEVGFDARLRAAGVFDYKNPLWDIDGLRHLLEPRLSYRYAPEADSGRAYIPALDRRVFSTYLQPLSIADRRNIDDLEALNTVRLSLNNTLQTRSSTGSRDLLALNFAADYRFDHAASQRPLSDIHTELAVTPADWLSFSVYQRFTPQTSSQQELNYAVEITDQHWWSARLSSYFLRDDYQEYGLDYRQRLNEIFDAVGRWRYDVRNSRFNEQTYGISQRLGQTWAIKYEVSFSSGPRRESSFGFNLEIELLKF